MARSVFHVLALCAMAALACKPVARNTTESITSPNQVAGKWVATVAVGKGMEASKVLALRDTLMGMFTSPRGGVYQNAFHLSDVTKAAGELIDEDLVRDKFVELKGRIGEFKRVNPASPAMVVLGMSGHGLEANGTYTFALEDGDHLSGADIASLVGDLGADEVIVILQSCFSGNITRRDFPIGTRELVRVAENATLEARARGVHLAVLTPASGSTASPADVWESLLRNAFENAVNRSTGVVTYQSWKTEIRRLACASNSFFPEEAALADGQTIRYYDLSRYPQLPASDEAVRSGIDPHFFEHIPANLPLFLTAQGERAWTSGTLSLPARDSLVPLSDVPVADDVTTLCQEATNVQVAAVQATKEQARRVFQEGTVSERRAYARDLHARTFTARDIADLASLVSRDPDPFVRSLLERHPPTQ